MAEKKVILWRVTTLDDRRVDVRADQVGASTGPEALVSFQRGGHAVFLVPVSNLAFAEAEVPADG